MTAPAPEQMRALADSADESLSYIGEGDWYPQDTMLQQNAAALRAAADQLEAVQTLLTEAHDKFAATYDRNREQERGPSSIGVAGAPLALSVQHALDLLRAKATANIERLTADTAPHEDRDE